MNDLHCGIESLDRLSLGDHRLPEGDGKRILTLAWAEESRVFKHNSIIENAGSSVALLIMR